MSVRPSGAISASSFKEIFKNPVQQQRLKVAAVALVTLAALGIVMALSFKISLLLMPLIIPVAVGGILIAKKLLNRPSENKAPVSVPSTPQPPAKTATELYVEKMQNANRLNAEKKYQECAELFFQAEKSFSEASQDNKKMRAMGLEAAIHSIKNYIELCGILNSPLDLANLSEHQTVLKHLKNIEEKIKDEKDTCFHSLRVCIQEFKTKHSAV